MTKDIMKQTVLIVLLTLLATAHAIAGTLVFQRGWAPTTPSCNTSGDSYTGTSSGSLSAATFFGGADRYTSIKFTAGASVTVCKVIARLSKTGSPTFNVNAAIYTDSSGSPGTLLGSESTATTVSTLTSSEGDFTLSGMSASLTSGTVYHLVIHTAPSFTGNGTDYINWFYVFAGGAGIAKTSPDAVTWSAASSNTQLKFTLYH